VLALNPNLSEDTPHMDFTQPPPQVLTLEEAQQIIDAAWAANAELRLQLQALTQKISEQQEKLNTSSQNSSLPPSSDLFKKKKKKKKYHGKGRSCTKKQGAQPGHKGKGRSLLPPEEVDHTVVVLPDTTCNCGGQVTANPDKVKRHQQFELPVIKPIVTEYQQVYGACSDCGSTHYGALPLGVPKGILAPRAIASVGILTGDYHLSKRATQSLFADFFSLSVSLGTISNAEETVSSALQEPVDEAKEHVKNQPVVHADETSHKNKGNKRWMWLAATALVAVFIIRGHRSAKDAKALLGETFQGILVSDRWSAYTWVNISFRQFCWAHLTRDFIKISERSGQAGRIGDQLLDSVRRMFYLWWRVRDGTLKRKHFILAMKPIRNQVEKLLKEGTTCGDVKTENTCKNLFKTKEALWKFIDYEGVEPTNNHAEQIIRGYVLWRKSSFGTQSERGDQYVERMMTVTATCALQGRNRHEYITSAVTAHLRKEPAPSLLPVENTPATGELAA
jgi:transposase